MSLSLKRKTDNVPPLELEKTDRQTSRQPLFNVDERFTVLQVIGLCQKNKIKIKLNFIQNIYIVKSTHLNFFR